MLAVTEAAVRNSFVNCSRGESRRLTVPKDLAELQWDDLDFLGWRDPSGSDEGYIVAEVEDALVGVVVRAATASGPRRSLCSVCLTPHTGGGVSLMTARRAGREGRQGNSVGVYLCSDLACSLYVRGKKNAGRPMDETITVGERIARTRNGITAFLHHVTA